MGMTTKHAPSEAAPELRRLAIRDLLVAGLRRHLCRLRRAESGLQHADNDPAQDGLAE